MTNTVGPLGSTTSSAYTNEAAAQSNANAGAAEATPAAESDAVTLSGKAAGAASLVEAAQGSDGIDHQAVSQIKNALANGNYSVAPEDLAKAIATVLRGSR